MAKKKPSNDENAGATKRPIVQYHHKGKTRVNNPPVGLVTPQTDPDPEEKKTYQYDPHLDPQLVWAGKAERCSFQVPTVSLHVHERIDPRTIIRAVQKRNGDGSGSPGKLVQRSLFEEPQENPPLREAIDFYRHAHGWSNRLIAGDSLMVMNSLLEKEGMAGKVQMVYIDPPYGIKYGSNFQPFVSRRDVRDGKDEDLTQEPEMIRAFRDTWELGIHSYLSYLRDRLLLARDLLQETGSCFVQISDENLHHVRELLDEVFDASNFCSLVTFKKTTVQTADLLSGLSDYVLWYAKDRSTVKHRPVFVERDIGDSGSESYVNAFFPNGETRRLTSAERSNAGELPKGVRFFAFQLLQSERQGRPSGPGSAMYFPVTYEGTTFYPRGSRGWTTTREGMEQLKLAMRCAIQGSSLVYVRYLDDFPAVPLGNLWNDTQSGSGMGKVYVVQTNTKVIQRCMLMATDPGELVLDPTCGSGTTANVAEQWGRRWITCDTSRVAIALAKQRLMTGLFDYFELLRPDDGVGSGFVYKTVPHVTLKSIANNPEIRKGMTRAEVDAAIAKYAEQETLYDQPNVDRSRVRVTGPFTVEAVPAPAVRPVTEIVVESKPASLDSQAALPGLEQLDAQSKLEFTEDVSVARYGETLRQRQWRDELMACGIRAKGGQRIEFSRLEPLGATRWLQCEGETKGGRVERVVVSFGPEHAPLEQRQVALALEEAESLHPAPKVVVFAAFQFDPEAAKDIDETKWPGVALLKVQMNTDLLTDDLKKKRASNESYWLMGQPDVAVVSEQWLVDGTGRMVMPYEFCEVLSGVSGLAKINAIDEGDLRLYAAMAQRGDLWVDLADSPRGGLGSVEHRRGAGSAGEGGIHSVSGHRPRFLGRIGDAADLIERLGLHDARRRRKHVDPLRGDRAIVEWAAALSLRKPLTTSRYSQITVHGFDYFNPRTGAIESGDTSRIAMWMLDTDYDGRSLFPRQVFFPMAGPKDGWARLAKNLKAEIDEDLIEAYRGTVSLPFAPGDYRRAAVKIVDDRGIESLKIVEIV